MIRTHAWRMGAYEPGEGCASVRVPQGEDGAWFEVFAPDAEETETLVETLGLHEVSFRDAARERHPPKLEDYGDYLFIIAHTPAEDEGGPTRKIAIFLAKRWILSVTLVPLETVERVETIVASEPERYLQAPERVAHALLEEQVLGFESLVDEIMDRVDALECSVATHAEPKCLHAIQDARRQASKLMRVVRAQRDVMQTLSRTNHEVLSHRIVPYLRDVYDHCLRVHDNLEAVRDSIGMARDSYLSAVNNRLSETMRVLTVIATIMMPLGVVAGVFGMNFNEMPLLGNRLGFWVTMGAMAATATGMIVWFKRKRWI